MGYFKAYWPIIVVESHVFNAEKSNRWQIMQNITGIVAKSYYFAITLDYNCLVNIYNERNSYKILFQ